MGFEDKSTNNFQLTAFGDSLISTAAKVYGTGSAYFDGNGDYLTVPDISAFKFDTGDFTVECWIKPDSVNPSPNSIDVGTIFTTAFPNDYQGIYIGIQPNFKLNWLAGSGGSWAFQRTINSPSIDPNVWTHVAYVRNGNTLSIYINGVLADSYNYGAANISNANNQIVIGGRPLATQYYKGYIDDLRITKGVARYTTNTFQVPTTELLDPTDPYINNVSLLLHMDGLSGSTSFLDSSNNNLTLTRVGTPTLNRSIKKFGVSSGYFNSNSDYVTYPSSDLFRFGTNDFTIEAWIYPTGTSSFQGLCGIDQYTNGILIRWHANTTPDPLYINGTVYNWEPATYAPVNTWSHIALVRNSGNVKMFVNGVNRIGNVTNTSNLSGSSVFILGTSPHSLSEGFNGYVDEFRVTKGVARYTSDFIPPTAPFPNTTTFPLSGLLAFWPLNEASRIRYDISGNGRHLVDRNNNVTGAPGLLYNAAQFTGVTTKTLSSANNLPIGNTQPFTLSFWVNYPSFIFPGSRIITFNPTGQGTAEWGIIQNGTAGAIFNNFGSSRFAISYDTPNHILPGQWNHVVVTKDSSYNWKYYRNNVFQLSAARDSTNWFSQNNAEIFIGQNVYGFQTDGPPNGLIDAVGIWNRVLTDQEISRLYNSGNCLEI